MPNLEDLLGRPIVLGSVHTGLNLQCTENNTVVCANTNTHGRYLLLNRYSVYTSESTSSEIGIQCTPRGCFEIITRPLTHCYSHYGVHLFIEPINHLNRGF